MILNLPVKKPGKEKEKMKRIVRSAGVLSILVSLLMLLSLTAVANHPGNANQAEYWEAHYADHNAVCFKHESDKDRNAHGYIVDSETGDGEAVVLNTFNPVWPGDHWEALIIKSGSENSQNNPVQRVVIDHPSAGVKYDAPVGGNGKVKDASHWIVCKGETPDTTTTTLDETTTTTMIEETTTTVEDSTTTTVVNETTTTPVVDQVTTTVAEETTTTVAPITSTSPSTPTTQLAELPFTGVENTAPLALVLLAAGSLLVILSGSRRHDEDLIEN